MLDIERVIVVVGCVGCGNVELAEPRADDAQAMTVAGCALATRDAVLVSTTQQLAGANSPTQYDSPFCNDGYIVEFDGTVNGVHYGYRIDTPQSPTEGIRVSVQRFGFPSTYSSDVCPALSATVFLYEKRPDNSWNYLESRHTTPVGVQDRGRFLGCDFSPMIFSNPPVVKGTASAPHIYRVAASVTADAAFQDIYPAGAGLGVVHIDAN